MVENRNNALVRALDRRLGADEMALLVLPLNP
jgi:hypothetical protein